MRLVGSFVGSVGVGWKDLSSWSWNLLWFRWGSVEFHLGWDRPRGGERAEQSSVHVLYSGAATASSGCGQGSPRQPRGSPWRPSRTALGGGNDDGERSVAGRACGYVGDWKGVRRWAGMHRHRRLEGRAAAGRACGDVRDVGLAVLFFSGVGMFWKIGRASCRERMSSCV